MPVLSVGGVEMPKKEERVFRALLRHTTALNKRYGHAPLGTFRSAVVQPVFSGWTCGIFWRQRLSATQMD